MISALPQVGGTELLIVLFIILLLFGAKRIPQLARSVGSGTREFRKGISGAYDDLDEAAKVAEPSKVEEESSQGGAPPTEHIPEGGQKV